MKVARKKQYIRTGYHRAEDEILILLNSDPIFQSQQAQSEKEWTLDLKLLNSRQPRPFDIVYSGLLENS